MSNFREMYFEGEIDGKGLLDEIDRLRAELDNAAAAAVAASQPAGEPVGYFDPDVLAHLTEGLIDPVGVLRRKPNGTSNVPVWLGPPAQAVDLEEFTDEDVKAWVERNDLGGSFGSLTDARCAFDDARSARLDRQPGGGQMSNSQQIDRGKSAPFFRIAFSNPMVYSRQLTIAGRPWPIVKCL